MVLSRGPLDKRFGLENLLWEISGPREIDFSVGYVQAAVWVVKGKIAVENSPGFPAQIDDLCLKYCILGDDSKNKSSGRSPRFPRKFPAPSDNYRLHQLMIGRGELSGLMISGRNDASQFNR